MQYNTNNSYLFSEKNIYIEKIIKLGGKKISELEKLFIKLFYWHAAMNDVLDKEIEHFRYFADIALDFFQERKKNEIKISVYSPNFLENNNKFSVVEIICEDMPFLVDSVISGLSNLEIKIYRIITPVISIKRNNAGQLIEIYENQSPVDATKDSIIHLHIEHIDDAKKIKQITEIIRNIIKYVNVSVDDWHLMLNNIENYISLFQEKVNDNKLFEEKVEFLKILKSKYFIFLGSAHYKIKNNKTFLEKDSLLGILKFDNELLDLIQSTVFKKDHHEKKLNHIVIGKLNKASIVHRNANLDYVSIETFDGQNNLIEATIYIGLFTSILYYQSATLIPIIRRKVASIIQKSGFEMNGYSAKELISIIESLPRDELFQIKIEDLFKIVMEVSALLHFPALRFFINRNDEGKFASCLIFIPHDRVSPEVTNEIHTIIKSRYGNIITSNYVHINNSKMCYYHIIVDLNYENYKKTNCAEIEQELNHTTILWKDDFKNLLIEKYGITIGYNYYNIYHHSFPEGYKERYSPDNSTINDIINLEKINQLNKEIFSISFSCPEDVCSIQLKIYSSKELPLSDVIKMLHDLGFYALAEHVFKIDISVNSSKWLHIFYLKTKECNVTYINDIKDNIESCLEAVWQKQAISDEYNKLILSCGFVYREVAFLRSIGKYLYQIKFSYSKEFMGQALTLNPEMTKLLLAAFKCKFDPEFDERKRKSTYEFLTNEMFQTLNGVKDQAEDQVIRKYIEIIAAIVRTNYFLNKEYISFKIDSSKINNLPKPIPFMEIFVSSSKFKAIHLRGAKVSRGGLRWSDRTEDFRTEVLGLMKAQIPKNSIIVPSGSKGGFVVYPSANFSKEEYYTNAVECYKNFLRGLLDITDNIVKDKIIHPKNIVCWDGEDPYLVVAADKGTATFSDIANSISNEYKFWLGDAFASGGSAGYDHKKMAITAKGAWVSVTRHFAEMNFDLTNKDFTVIGVGDMSGDVFGNGMLLSEHIQLVAAFNHLHIFLDPNPNSKVSFKERKRLFNLKGSSWTDYDQNLISKGGGVFDRKAKTIELSEEVRKLLDIQVKTLTPDELINTILKANVDLLWNGGIGTYVKASFEENIHVGDKANDNFRINGIDLRCKVVGEGGNLGFTQAGRIEYARNGGRINTDAIDNSAGVDCSDHEVNIKIILEKIVQNKKIPIAERDKLLEKMTDDVAELVLRDNYLQTLALSISEWQGFSQLNLLKRMIENLQKEGRIDRKLQSLPNDEALAQLAIAKKSLTRPETSVLLAYSKISIFDNLVESKLLEDPYFAKELISYFPKMMQEKYKKEIESHPLRKEIIATILSNSLVNRVSLYFVHLTSQDNNHNFADIAKAYTVIKDIFELEKLWDDVENINKIDSDLRLELYFQVKKFTIQGSLRLLRSYEIKDLGSAILHYKDGINEIFSYLAVHIKGSAKIEHDKNLQKYLSQNVPSKIVNKIALLPFMSSAFSIINIAKLKIGSLDKITEIYFSIGDFFRLDWLKSASDSLTIDYNWQRLAARGLKNELYDLHHDITKKVAKFCQEGDKIEDWAEKHHKHISRFLKHMDEIKEFEHIEYAMLDLALKYLKELV